MAGPVVTPPYPASSKRSALSLPLVALLTLLVSACGAAGALGPDNPAHPSRVQGNGAGRMALPPGRTTLPASPRISALPPDPPLNAAEKESKDLGLVPPGQTITLTLTLKQRGTAQLDALLARGERLTPSQWAGKYGPSSTATARARATLARAGITSQWSPGEVSMAVSAGAARIERFFGIPVHEFLMPDGTRFYGPLRPFVAPPAIAHEVVAITGGDDYRDYMTAAIEGPDGVTPAQMTSFYDMTPLRNSGVNGNGVTVMFPEWAVPTSDVLAAYAQKFNLPAFNVSVVTKPSAWGAPATPGSQQYADVAGEAALDLEVVHGLAPGAKEVVYEAGNPSDLLNMLEAMVTAHPGAILSSSIFVVSCEQDQDAKQVAMASDSVFAQAASEGTSVFWAAGDRGAFACLPDGNSSTEETVSVSPMGASPHVTSVGGTTVFLASNGAYYKESAWGEPIEQWGGGGGFSTIFQRPSWQVGPGTSGITGRGVPDVAANADIESGWDIFSPPQSGQNGPQEGPVGGTSAATPCWAAIAALIDQYLHQQNLRSIGFADPALYFFSTNPKGLPAVPFHQITEGSNLHYPATAGWNPATGLGSPDVGHLADDFVWYDRAHAGSPS